MNPHSPQMLVALNHVFRRRILRAFEDREQLVDPTQLAGELEISLCEVGYHIGILVKSGAVELAEGGPASGTVDRLYRLTTEGEAEWVREVLEASQDCDDENREN